MFDVQWVHMRYCVRIGNGWIFINSIFTLCFLFFSGILRFSISIYLVLKPIYCDFEFNHLIRFLYKNTSDSTSVFFLFSCSKRKNAICWVSTLHSIWQPFHWSLFFMHMKRRNERKPNRNLTYRLIDETLGTLSCEQIPSANNRSRISQANIVGFSRL